MSVEFFLPDKPYTPQEAMKQVLDKAESPDDAIAILEKYGFKLEASEPEGEDKPAASPFGLEAFRKKAVDAAMPDEES